MLDVWFISSAFFGLPALLLTAAAVAAGTFLAVRQFSLYMKLLNSALDSGDSPAIPFMNLVMIGTAILLLMMPGLISDIIAVLLLIPPIRYLTVSHIILRFNDYRNNSRCRSSEHSKSKQKPPDIIDV